MPVYEYKCKDHPAYRTTIYSPSPPDTNPESSCCYMPMTRVFSFNQQPMFQETYSPSVGDTVSSMHKLREHGKRLSEVHAARLSEKQIMPDGSVSGGGSGNEPNYIPVDYRDKEACGATSEGLYEQAKAHHDMGNHKVAERIEKHI